MTVIAKSAKRHPAAKKCCGWEEPAICGSINKMLQKQISIYKFLQIQGVSKKGKSCFLLISWWKIAQVIFQMISVKSSLSWLLTIVQDCLNQIKTSINGDWESIWFFLSNNKNFQGTLNTRVSTLLPLKLFRSFDHCYWHQRNTSDLGQRQ